MNVPNPKSQFDLRRPARVWSFGHWDLFRISDFGFRVSADAAKQTRRLLLAAVVCVAALLTLAAPASAAERFPPPQFETEHELPSTTTPQAGADVQAYLDVGLLAVGLIVASFLVLKWRSRRGLFVLMIACLVYFGFWREGCVCPIGAIQNVTLGLADASYAVPLTVIAIFVLPLLFALFFGRSFCAGVCPHGAIQDAILLKPIRLPAWLEHTLGLLPYVYLGLAVMFASLGGAFVICRYDPFVALFRLSGGTMMLSIGAGLLVLGIFVGRPYCRFLCPYGVLLRWMSRAAKWNVTVTPDQCTQCRLCEGSCPYGAINAPETADVIGERRPARRRLALLLMLLPILVVLGGWSVAQLSGAFASLAPTQRPPDIVQGGIAALPSGAVSAEAIADSAQRAARFHIAAWILGGWLGLIVGLKLIGLSARRTHHDFEADRAACLSCGRCYRDCPEELARLGLIEPTVEGAAP